MKATLRPYSDHPSIFGIVLLSVACYALFFYGLGGIGLVGPDEPRYSSIARAASMDMLLTVCLTAALVFFLFAFNDTTPRRETWFRYFYAALGLGIVAKGPVAVLLPFLSLGAFLFFRGRWDEWRTWYPKGL